MGQICPHTLHFLHLFIKRPEDFGHRLLRWPDLPLVSPSQSVLPKLTQNSRQVNPDTLQMTPRCLLVGHTAPILCISKASILQDNNYIVSSSEAGEMCTWDLVDGRCREHVKLPQVHTNMQVRNVNKHVTCLTLDKIVYFSHQNSSPAT